MRATTIALMILFFTIGCTITYTINAQSFKIRENSWIGKLAAHLHGTPKYAVTIGRTIYISTSEDFFLDDTQWFYHEATHLYQYRRLGTREFLTRYMICWMLLWKHDLIPFEKEATYNEDNLITPK